MNLFGIVRVINETQTFDNTDFKKRNIVIESVETGTPYSLDFTNKNIELTEQLLLGSMIKVDIVIRGNYDKKDANKCYNSFEVKFIQVIPAY